MGVGQALRPMNSVKVGGFGMPIWSEIVACQRRVFSTSIDTCRNRLRSIPTQNGCGFSRDREIVQSAPRSARGAAGATTDACHGSNRSTGRIGIRSDGDSSGDVNMDVWRPFRPTTVNSLEADSTALLIDVFHFKKCCQAVLLNSVSGILDPRLPDSFQSCNSCSDGGHLVAHVSCGA